jgi:hypothetical protein
MTENPDRCTARRGKRGVADETGGVIAEHGSLLVLMVMALFEVCEVLKTRFIAFTMKVWLL